VQKISRENETESIFKPIRENLAEDANAVGTARRGAAGRRAPQSVGIAEIDFSRSQGR